MSKKSLGWLVKIVFVNTKYKLTHSHNPLSTSFTLINTHTLPLSLSPSFTRTHTHTLSLSLFHTHKHFSCECKNDRIWCSRIFFEGDEDEICFRKYLFWNEKSAFVVIFQYFFNIIFSTTRKYKKYFFICGNFRVQSAVCSFFSSKPSSNRQKVLYDQLPV